MIAGILVSCCILAGCSRNSADVTVDWNVQPPRPSAGVDTIVQLKVVRGDTAPVIGAKLHCTAQMLHPGMAPIIATVVERGAGIYEARLQFSMAGDWILSASGELADGRRIDSAFRIPGVEPGTPAAPLR